MNSLVRRVQNRNDISKIHAVLDICYQAGVAHEKLGAAEDSSAYVQGRVRDLVELLGLEFNNEGNIDWSKIINEKDISNTRDEATTDDLSFDARGYIDART